MRHHWIAVNRYRSATSCGFANTWNIYLCTRSEQIQALIDGLLLRNGDLSTQGVRLATRQEIAYQHRTLVRFGEFAIDVLDITESY